MRESESKVAMLTVRVLQSELAALRELAARQERSVSDTVRRVLRQAVRRSQASGEAQGDARR